MKCQINFNVVPILSVSKVLVLQILHTADELLFPLVNYKKSNFITLGTATSHVLLHVAIFAGMMSYESCSNAECGTHCNNVYLVLPQCQLVRLLASTQVKLTSFD
jgi:hypothetical protein